VSGSESEATLEVEGSAWDELVAAAGCTDVYYLRGYLEASAVARSGRCAYLYLRDEGGAVVFPCIVREQLEPRSRDVTTVAYGGPLGLGVTPPIAKFSTLYEKWCADQGIVTTFVRFHPLFANHRYAPSFLRRTPTEGSVAWPLERDLLGEMHRHHRRLIRKAEAAGVEVSVTVGPAQLDGFAALYEQTMRRLGAASFYFFPELYWERLTHFLGDEIVLFEALVEGSVVASVVCFATRPWLHYHLGATSDDARRLGASHLLLYASARFGQEQGYEQFHLGSGVGAGGGSLLEFKRRFASAPLLEQWFGKGVHDVERYLSLTGASEIDYDGFFPAYGRETSSVAPPIDSAKESSAG
jgi:serine/alanine adding enzyme